MMLMQTYNKQQIIALLILVLVLVMLCYVMLCLHAVCKLNQMQSFNSLESRSCYWWFDGDFTNDQLNCIVSNKPIQLMIMMMIIIIIMITIMKIIIHIMNCQKLPRAHRWWDGWWLTAHTWTWSVAWSKHQTASCFNMMLFKMMRCLNHAVIASGLCWVA